MTLEKLTGLYPQFNFIPGDRLHWNAAKSTITYDKNRSVGEQFAGLLHETAHGILNHHNFSNDIELITLERDAWSEAKELAKKLKYNLPQDYIDNCMDTYRDWLYKRAKCPQCALVGIQTGKNAYSCIFCAVDWQVPSSRLCAIRRQLIVK